MNILCAPTGIIFPERPKQGIMDIKNAEFTNILLDTSMFCTPYELESIGKENIKKHKKQMISEAPEKLCEIIKPFVEKCKNEDISFSVAKAPFLNWDTKHEDLNELIGTLAKESIKACGKCGCEYLIVNPLFAGISDKELWSVNKEFYLGLVPLAKENNVKILLVNQCKNFNGHLIRGICSDGDKAAEWIDRLNKEAGDELFGFCMDVGASNICGQNMYDFIKKLGSRLKAVILRDCDGNENNALLPFTSVNKRQSQTDWLNLIRGLREFCFDGELIIDLSDTASAFSPILRPALMKLAKEVANYFKWQIEIESVLKKYSSIVLFGAGNMCRNYMKCYGDKYPPLFTCDNNKSIWGTQFCGLEIKSPESLKDIPEDCAVFICNTYYREIEQQLRDMNIQNPIEFFNDEYMPSFYVDRLDAEGDRKCYK